MPDLRDKHTAALSHPVGTAETLLIAVAFGVVGAAGFVVFEVMHHARHVLPVDVLIAIGFASVPAVLGFIIFTLFLHFAFAFVLHDAPSRRVWTATLLAVLVISLSAAVVLVATKSHRDLTGFLLVLASLPTAGLAAFFVLRRSWFGQPGCAVSMCLAFLLAALIVVLGATAIHAQGYSAAWNLVTIGLAGASTFWAVPRIPRTPARMGWLLALCLIVTCSVFPVLGNPDLFVPLVPQAGQSVRRPNVVLVVLDTTRRDRLGCYGHSGGLTPELDRVAGEGVVYEQAITPSPWTIPSHASMFTGLFPPTHGCWNGDRVYLEEENVTLAERLGDLGFHSAAFVSNFTLIHTGVLQGFETVQSLVGANEDLSVQNLARLSGVPRRWVDRGADEGYVTIRRWLSHPDRAKAPFFLFLNLFEAHAPYVPPMQERVAHLPPDTGYLETSWRAIHTQNDVLKLQLRHSTDPQARAFMGALYEAGIRYQDRRLGDILRLIAQYSDPRHTLLIVTADHGENLGDGGRWDHTREVNDALIHVPLVIRYPRLFPPGKRVSGLCQTRDLFATVLDVVGEPAPQDSPTGRSLVPSTFTPRDVVFAQLYQEFSDFYWIRTHIGWTSRINAFDVERRVIRTNEYAFVWRSDGQHRLFDVVNDPDETFNLVEHEPELAKRMQERLEAWWAALPKHEPSSKAIGLEPVDEKTLEKLRAIGYVQ